MLNTQRIAFKEWASIVQLLGTGEQVLILRKGGIHEKGKKFNVAHEEFFLFPTFEHQSPRDLKPEGEKILKQVLEKKPARDILPIQFYCVVQDGFWISDEKTLEPLEPFHLWSRDCLKARFHWGEEKGLFGILVRTYSLPEVVNLENLTRYGGCRSWVELERPIETRLLEPVLGDNLFQEKAGQIHQVIEEFAS